VRQFSRGTGRAVVLGLLTLVATALAAKPQTLVVAGWRGAPPSAPLGQDVSLVLRLVAAADASEVIVGILPTDGVAVVEGDRRWSGSMAKDQVLDLPYTIRVVANGDWTLGASVTNKRPDSDQVSGAVLRVRARDGVAMLTNESADAANR
jgi:hypothetical protein